MKHVSRFVSVVLLLSLCGCRRDDSPRNPVQPGPNALDPNGRLRSPTRAGAAGPSVGLVEGRSKHPLDKPGDERFRVRPEWYPTGSPGNPYPPGTVIPEQPPAQNTRQLPSMVPIGGPQPTQGGPQIPAPQPFPTMPGPSAQPGQLPAMVPLGPPVPTGSAPPSAPGMQPVPAPGMQPMPAPGAPSSSPQVQRFTGQLGPSSQRDAQGRFFATHEVTLHRGQRVTVTMESAQFDTVLRVEPAAGEAIENDDVNPPETNSRVDFTAPTDGRYRIIATTYAVGMAGAYVIQLQAGAPGQGLTITGGNAPSADAQLGPGGTITPGTPVNEHLTPGDVSSGGRFVRAYRLEGRAGDMVRLRLESTGFDPTLTLIAANGQRWFNDDTTPQDTNSTVQVTLPVAGHYRVEVSSYQPGATGPFTLTFSNSARPTVGPNGAAPSGGIAGRRGEGSMYGVFVGITDYGGSGNLFGCADDARQLAQAYINARLGAASQFVVLTDAEATMSAVRAAFAQVAPRVGPNDVFMFFHSGHGNRHASQDRVADPDGYVETIVLRDGEISSREMAGLFATVRADVGMLALDSCYAGGFARAFGSAPNRFGMYSSEEDVLSQVAQRYQAGGYLSYFLRRGVTEADTNRDGSLRAGELADYLHARFAENLRQMRTQDGADTDTWQTLVINRTAVALSDMLWRFPAVN